MYSVRVAPDGVVYAGTESAGVIRSADHGATWHPLDPDYADPNSPLGRVNNAGNVGGIGFTAGGKVVVQGQPGAGGSPPQDPSHVYLWLADPVAHTVATAGAFPAYFFGGQQVSQIVTDAAGTLFLHSDVAATRADGTTGPGGVFASTDGLSWTPFNAGINSAFFVPSLNQWVDTNGKGAEGSIAVVGNDVYLATTDGRIWRYTDAVPEPSAVGVAAVAAAGAELARRRRRKGANLIGRPPRPTGPGPFRAGRFRSTPDGTRRGMMVLPPTRSAAVHPKGPTARSGGGDGP
ncbi:MAG: hypothetical protein JWO31_1035 [Phycisphaerales bacterium]|nr:hypothetical protein [Phycisphaerales bacterium]